MAIASALLLDGASERVIDRIRGEMVRAGLGADPRGIQPHITLAVADDGDIDRWKYEIDARIESPAPIDLTFSHIGWFPLVSALFLAPAVSYELKKIQEMSVAALVAAGGTVNSFYSSDQWVPHVTLMVGVDRSLAEQALKIPAPAISMAPMAERLVLGEAVPDSHDFIVDSGAEWQLGG